MTGHRRLDPADHDSLRQTVEELFAQLHGRLPGVQVELVSGLATGADQIAAADAVVISTPEYNKGPSGVLKNALDWVSRTKGAPWRDKPVAVMSAAAGRAGGERAQMILRGFLVPFRPRLLYGPELHLADSGNAFDADGRLVGELYLKTLEELVQALKAEIAR